MSVYLLEINSFRGVSMGAQHWYGKISCQKYDSDFKPVSLTFEIKDEHRNLMYEYYRSQGFTPEWVDKELQWDWIVGEMTTRFFSIEEIETEALAWFRANLNPKRDLLVKWRSVYMFSVQEGDRILDGSPTLIEKFNEISGNRAKDDFLRGLQ